MAGKYSITNDDIAGAFARIEDELLSSMMRNFENHRAQEVAEGYDWVQWQAIQLDELSKYTRANVLRYGTQFDELNDKIDELIERAYREGYSLEEAKILEAIRDGYSVPQTQDTVFGAPEERLNALIRATHEDMFRAEYATLRRAEDVYRKTIFDAVMYATSGAGTYEQAIDMATKDFLMKGIDGIVYSNGSRHSIREYSQMAVRTATKRASLAAEGQARSDWGIHTIFVNYRTDACPECMEWVGQVLIDDVYSDGTAQEAMETGYSLLSDAMAQGLFHPNCRDTSSTYFEGINEPPRPFTPEEMEHSEEHEALEQDLSNAEQHAREWSRVAELSLDSTNRELAAERAEGWEGERKRLTALIHSPVHLKTGGLTPEEYALQRASTTAQAQKQQPVTYLKHPERLSDNERLGIQHLLNNGIPVVVLDEDPLAPANIDLTIGGKLCEMKNITNDSSVSNQLKRVRKKWAKLKIDEPVFAVFTTADASVSFETLLEGLEKRRRDGEVFYVLSETGVMTVLGNN